MNLCQNRHPGQDVPQVVVEAEIDEAEDLVDIQDEFLESVRLRSEQLEKRFHHFADQTRRALECQAGQTPVSSHFRS